MLFIILCFFAIVGFMGISVLVPKGQEKYETRNTPEMIEKLVNEIRKDYPDFDYDTFFKFAINSIKKDNESYCKLNFDNMANYETVRLLNYRKSEYNLALGKEVFRTKSYSYMYYVDLISYSSNEIVVDVEMAISDVIIDLANTKHVNLISSYVDTVRFIFKNENQKEVNICPNCNAVIEHNNIGKCEYCGTVIKTNKTPWLLDKITYTIIDYEEDRKAPRDR